MSLGELIQRCMQWLSETSIALAISSSPYFFPVLETVHVIGVGLVIGTISMVDLRLLGLASRGRSVRSVANHMLPISWAGFGIALLSGALMFTANATMYAANPAFQLKLVVLLIAGINMLAFHGLTYRSVAAWDDADKPPAPVKLAGAVSLSCWIVIVFLGRWIGFV